MRDGRFVSGKICAVSDPDNSAARCSHRECAHPESERVLTAATVITFLRTAGALVLALWAAHTQSLTLLLWALGVYWVGDIVDGMTARLTNRETRTGATLDILCDRISAAFFYLGFAWYDPTMIVPVGIYLAEFMVIDTFISLAFLAWPLSSPNYFYLVDRRIWRWNWSKPGKAINSGLFAILMVTTRLPWLAGAIAIVLLAVKVTSMVWLARLRLPVPDGCAHLRGSQGTS